MAEGNVSVMDRRPTAEQNALKIDNVTMHYKTFKALKNVSLNVAKGEFVTILGPSGSGKTTLLKVIAGFEPLSDGAILLNKKDIADKQAYEREIGMLFQNYALFPHMTVFNNIAYPLKLRKVPKNEMNKLVHDALKLVHMDEHASKLPQELSGGQQQRVALARAIVYEPPLLLLDEPLSALDKNLRQEMQLEIKRIQKATGITTICVTHDQEEAITMSDRVCVMNDGQIEQVDRPEDLYQRPKNKFIAQFIGEINLLEGNITGIETDNLKVNIGNQQDILVGLDKELNYKLNETINIAVRPEKINIVKNNEHFNNLVEVKVKEVIYVGDSLKINTETKTGVEINVKVSSESPDYISPDENVLLGWDLNDVTIIPE